jgi:hypothetical protein
MWRTIVWEGGSAPHSQTAAFESATMDVESAAREGGGAADRFSRFGGAGVFSAEEEDRAPARRGVIWPRTRSRRAVYPAKEGRRITQMSDFLPLLERCLSLRTSENTRLARRWVNGPRGKAARPKKLLKHTAGHSKGSSRCPTALR